MDFGFDFGANDLAPPKVEKSKFERAPAGFEFDKFDVNFSQSQKPGALNFDFGPEVVEKQGSQAGRPEGSNSQPEEAEAIPEKEPEHAEPSSPTPGQLEAEINVSQHSEDNRPQINIAPEMKSKPIGQRASIVQTLEHLKEQEDLILEQKIKNLESLVNDQMSLRWWSHVPKHVEDRAFDVFTVEFSAGQMQQVRDRQEAAKELEDARAQTRMLADQLQEAKQLQQAAENAKHDQIRKITELEYEIESHNAYVAQMQTDHQMQVDALNLEAMGLRNQVVEKDNEIARYQ